nr:zinc finger MYM-type protein 1 [Tanacetum cinerariifolium]
MRYFESIFGFMFDASKLAYLDDANLKECCLNLESALTNDEDCDIDGKDLFIELQILQEMLPKGAYDGERLWSSIEIMEFTKKVDMFPNVLLIQDFINHTSYGRIGRKEFFKIKDTEVLFKEYDELREAQCVGNIEYRK